MDIIAEVRQQPTLLIQGSTRTDPLWEQLLIIGHVETTTLLISQTSSLHMIESLESGADQPSTLTYSAVLDRCTPPDRTSSAASVGFPLHTPNGNQGPEP
jgi:hypothetical protein